MKNLLMLLFVLTSAPSAFAGLLECTQPELGTLTINQTGSNCSIRLVMNDGTRWRTIEDKNERYLCTAADGRYSAKLVAEEEESAKLNIEIDGKNITVEMVGAYKWNLEGLECKQGAGAE